MSYCVNCGVELVEAERCCPLCGVESINPASPFDPATERKYPEVPVGGYRRGFRDLVAPIAMIMLIPVLISIVCDVLTSGFVTWSVFVVASIVLVGLFLLPPLGMRKSRPLACLFIDWIGVGLFLFVLDYFTPWMWFFRVGLPLTCVGCVVSISVVALFLRVDMRNLVKAAISLFTIGGFVMFTDFMIKRYLGRDFPLGWSLIVIVPCVVLGIVALIVNRNHRLKEEMRQRFFV